MKPGRLTVPAETMPITAQSLYERSGEDEAVHLRFSCDPVLRRYMEETFYRSAPLPKALKLVDTLRTRDYLHQEIGTGTNDNDCY